jgi:hypothetical protein
MMGGSDWSDEAIARIESVQQELEDANPVFIECPDDDFRPYLREHFAQRRGLGPKRKLMLGRSVRQIKSKGGWSEEKIESFREYCKACKEREDAQAIAAQQATLAAAAPAPALLGVRSPAGTPPPPPPLSGRGPPGAPPPPGGRGPPGAPPPPPGAPPPPAPAAAAQAPPAKAVAKGPHPGKYIQAGPSEDNPADSLRQLEVSFREHFNTRPPWSIEE